MRYVVWRGAPLRALLVGLQLSACTGAWAAEESPRTYTIQGRFTDASGSAPLLDTISLTLGIYNPAGTCLLYEETQTGIDLTATDGVFSVQLGSVSTDVTKRTVNDPGRSMATVFANKGTQIVPNGPNCAGGYTPASGDGRKLRITYAPSAGAPVTLSPDQALNATPQSSVAETLQGLLPNEFLQVTGAASSFSTSKGNLDLLLGTGVGGVADASALHHHDGRYLTSSSTAQNVGSGGIYTTGAIGTGVAASPSGMQLEVRSSADNVIGAVIRPFSAAQSADLLQIRNNAGSPVFQVSPAGNLSINNATAATVANNRSSSTLSITGQYWTGAATATDSWTFQDVLGTGANPTSTLKLTHAGSTGVASMVLETTDPELRLTRTGAAGYATVNFDGQSLIGFDGTTGRMRISTNFTGNDILFLLGTGNDKYVSFKGDGNVGIGTANPLAPLDVYGGAGSTTTSSDINGQGAAGTGNITVGSTTGFPASGVMLIDTEAITYSVVNGTTLDIVARARLGTTGATHTNGASVSYIEQMVSKGAATLPHLVATSAGNVGIGTASPISLLHLNQPGANEVALQIQSDATEESVLHLRSGTKDTRLRQSDALFTIETEFNTSAMALLEGGSVGIGTTTPMAPLDVYAGAGTMTTTSTVNALGAAGTGNITVGSTAGFPASGTIQIEVEAMNYTVVNATTLNVTARARLGSTGAVHPNGAGVVYLESLVSKGATTAPHVSVNSVGWMGIGTATPGATLQLSSGSMYDRVPGFYASGTFSAVNTGDNTGGIFDYTSAGSGNFNQTALGAILRAGYTGTFDTAAAGFQNYAAGSSNNFGVVGAVGATGGGQNIGVAGYATLGTRNIGGYFAADWIDFPNTMSAALIADNVTSTAPIFVGIDNTTEVFRIADGGKVGILDPSPDTTLKVVGSICAKSDAADCAGAVAGTIYANNTTVQSADYAEYFHAEETLAPGELVGLNPANGLARAYRPSDRLLGIVSTSPGVVGNSEIRDERSVLVALMGQVPFRAGRVKLEGGQVLTPDGKPVGYLLADGRVYVNIGSTGQDRAIASLEAENARLARENAEIKSRLERIEKALLTR